VDRLDALYVVLGTVQALATLGALYYAWRTVDDARTDADVRRRERFSAQLGELAAIVSELDKWTRNANGFLAREQQLRLRIALTGVDRPLTKTREAATAEGIETLEVQAGFQPVIWAAQEELIAEGEALAAA
jgi:hypothetical protein